jgi:predicted RNA methylase
MLPERSLARLAIFRPFSRAFLPRRYSSFAARTAMGRFASTVAYYESARPPYGAAFFAAVARELGFDHSQRLLDIGVGPGLLAIGFAPCCRKAVGVDPEPAMVEAARAAAARATVKASFIEGRFEDQP